MTARKPISSPLISFVSFERSGDLHKASVGRDRFQVEEGVIEPANRPGNPFVVVIDQEKLAERTVFKIAELLLNDVPVVIGPRASRIDLLWDLKATVDARGGIFEIASSDDDFIRRLNSVATAYAKRLSSGDSFQARRARPLAEAFAKILERCDRTDANVSALVARLAPGAAAMRADPLAELPGIIAATQSLRSDRGLLDADRIGALFGFTRAEMARHLGVVAETVRVTPDSPSIQEKLKPFEGIAQLLTIVRTPENFRKWLNTPNPELDGKSPAEVVKSGRPDSIAVLAENILTNRGR
jgi:hypothetical protein